MAKHPRGVRPWKGGWQAYIRVNGTLYSKTYPIDTPLEEMKTWRHAQRVEHADTPKRAGTLEGDVASYLKRISAMPTAGQKEQHLKLWMQELGPTRSRRSIKTADVEQVMQRWLESGLAADTVRKRRTSLLSLFNRLDGKKASNPVRASQPPKASRPIVRGLDFAQLLQVLDSMPASDTQTRLRVLAWTGLPPGVLMSVDESDLDLEGAELRVRPRRKGRGADARVIPLAPQAVEAFRELARRKAFGKFAIPAAGVCLRRACRRVKVREIRLYDLRHSFGAQLYKTTRDLPTVARFLLHASLTSTARYAMATVGEVDRTAIRALAKGFTESPPAVVPPSSYDGSGTS